MSNNIVKEKHLVSVETAMKRYMDSGLVADILDTVPSTVDGGLWYETTSTAPIIKFKQGGSTYYLYTNQLVSPNLSLSSAAVTVTSDESQSITLSYSGNGVVSLSNPNTTALTAAYNSSNKTITLENNLTASDDDTNVNLGVSLSEAGQYAADNKTLAVTCQALSVVPVYLDNQLIQNGSTITCYIDNPHDFEPHVPGEYSLLFFYENLEDFTGATSEELVEYLVETFDMEEEDFEVIGAEQAETYFERDTDKGEFSPNLDLEEYEKEYIVGQTTVLVVRAEGYADCLFYITWEE